MVVQLGTHPSVLSTLQQLPLSPPPAPQARLVCPQHRDGRHCDDWRPRVVGAPALLYVYVYTYIHTPICKHTHTHTYTYIYLSIYISIHTYGLTLAKATLGSVPCASMLVLL